MTETPNPPKAWTPIGWNGPFRAAMSRGESVVLDGDNQFVCRAIFPRDATEIASALNTACQAGAVSEDK